MWSALALGAAYAVAGPADVAVPFDWDAPAECPPAAEVQATVERHIGASLGELSLERWSVVGVISGDGDQGWELALELQTPDGFSARTLNDPTDCGAVSDAGALLIALALDPEAVAQPASPSAADTKPETAPPADIVDDDSTSHIELEPTPSPTPNPRRKPPRITFIFGIAGGLDWGTLRRVSPMGRADFAWQLPRVRFAIRSTIGSTPGFPVPGVSQDISLWMWTVALEAGPVLRKGAFEFPLVGGIEAGQIVVSPRELLGPSRQQVTWAALLVTPGVAWVPRPWFALVARVGAVVSFVRPSFEIQGIGVIHAPAPAGIRASLGVEFRFPLKMMKTAAGGNKLERR